MVNFTDGDSMRLSLERKIDDSYDIVFGAGLFPRIARDLKENSLGSKYAIITDSNVREKYAKALILTLKDAGLEAEIFSFEVGEQSKRLRVCEDITGQMSKNRFGRDSAILALGGGVVGDMAGLMAADFNRGIPYIQIPTTLLAQADSSIGGKTAVDTEYGKNLWGSFKQPKRVYIDVSTLATLLPQDFRTGLAETIKHGIIQDKDFFKYLQANIGSISSKSTDSLLYLARQNCRIKGTVVEIDPDEKGLRRILNYGHTAGHAIEKVSNFELSHGDAVSIGMMVAGRISNLLGFFPTGDLLQQEELLVRAGLPVRIPKHITNEEIIEVTLRDKKAKAGKARYSLPLGIGLMIEFEKEGKKEYVTYVDQNIVSKALNKTR